MHSKKEFLKSEHPAIFNYMNLEKIGKFLETHKYIYFFIVGSSGAILNLAVTWTLTTFVFGIERYFTAYIFGIIVNLIYNFTFYSRAVFKTRSRHMWRFFVFVTYSILITFTQALLVKTLTPIIGLELYLLVIASVILFFSVINFFVFKLSIFNDKLHG